MATSNDSFISAEGAELIFGGSFVSKDGTPLSFTFSFWGRDGRDMNIDEWEKYEGVPFPSKLFVSHSALPGGRTAAGQGPNFCVITYTFEMLNGTPECTDVHIEPVRGSERGIRTRDREYIKIDDVLESALDYLTQWERSMPPSALQRRAAVGALMRRRRTTPEDVLRETARVYNENIEQAPTQSVADHFGISKSGADKRVKRARDAGFITTTAHTGRKPRQ